MTCVSTISVVILSMFIKKFLIRRRLLDVMKVDVLYTIIYLTIFPRHFYILLIEMNFGLTLLLIGIGFTLKTLQLQLALGVILFQRVLVACSGFLLQNIYHVFWIVRLVVVQVFYFYLTLICFILHFSHKVVRGHVEPVKIKMEREQHCHWQQS